MSAARRTVLFVLLAAVLAVLPLQAWGRVGRRSATVHSPNPKLERTEWRGSLQPDGTMAVRVTTTFTDHIFDDGTDRTFSLDVPDGAIHFRIGGRPAAVSDSDSINQVALRGTVLEYSYDLPDAAVRHPDGAVLDMAMLPSNWSPVGFGNAEVQGVLWLPGKVPPSRFSWQAPGLTRVRAEEVPGLVRFSGIQSTTQDIALLGRLPDDVVPEARRSAAPAGATYDARREELTKGWIPDGRPTTLDRAGRVVLALLLTGELAVLLVWGALRLARAVADRRAALEGVPDTVSEPPSKLSPDLVGLMVGERGRGRRSLVAGTILDLSRRDVIRLEAIDSDRFRLLIPPRAAGSTPAENLVIGALRPQGQSGVQVELQGPPLWGGGPYPWARAYMADVAKRARATSLFTVTLPMVLLVAVAVAMPLTALIGTAGTSTWAKVAIVVAPVLAVLTSLASGVVLTRAGRRERAQWLAFGAYIRSYGDLDDTGVPGVLTWGPYLAYGAVLGACPKAAEALSPRTGGAS